MAVLSLAELKTFLNEQSDKRDAVSIFMPTFKTGADTKQNPVVLEKLLAKAKAQLLEAAFTREADANNYLSPVKQLLNDKAAWQHPGSGLAIFLHKDYFQYYSLPIAFEETASVNYRLYIQPLIPLFGGESRFYVLALSQNAVRLIQYTNNDARQINLKGIVPGSLSEAMTPQRYERSLQFHTGEPGKMRNTVVFHGQGPDEISKDNIRLYFQQINDGLVQKTLRAEDAPMVIAGVEYLHPIYKKANTYRHLFDNGINGNPERLSAEDLRARALPILRPYFDTNKTNALIEYRELGGTGHTTNDVKQIVTNSYTGQVERLLIAAGSHLWGSFDENTHEFKLHDKVEPRDQDLIDVAAVNTLSNHGEVYVVKPEELPEGTEMCAVFRHEEHIPKLRHQGAAKTRG